MKPLISVKNFLVVTKKIVNFSLVLKKMRENIKNLTIRSYAEFHNLDASQIKPKQVNPLFDVDPANRKSNKRDYNDKDEVKTRLLKSNVS